MGSVVYMKFNDPAYYKYNGFYTARDTGGAVSGHIIDFFMGDFADNKPDPKVADFGRVKAKVIIIN